jgi:hypothetical protein
MGCSIKPPVGAYGVGARLNGSYREVVYLEGMRWFRLNPFTNSVLDSSGDKYESYQT